MLGDVKIIDKKAGQSCTWEYFCGNCGASMGRTIGYWPAPWTRRTEIKTCLRCKTKNTFNIIGQKL